MEEVRLFLTAFAALSPPSQVRLRLLEVPGATVATLGVSRFIPQVPEGGIWRLLPSATP